MSDHPISALLFGISHPIHRIGDDAGNQRIGCELFTISVMPLRDLHGLLNHFSVAFVVAGTLLEYYYFLKHHNGAERFASIMLLTGLSFSILSILTGFVTQEQSYIDTTVSQLLRVHRLASIVATAVLAAAIIVRRWKPFSFDSVIDGLARGTYIGLISVSLLLNVIAIYLGTELGYQHGVNVRAYEQVIQTIPDGPPDSSKHR